MGHRSKLTLVLLSPTGQKASMKRKGAALHPDGSRDSGGVSQSSQVAIPKVTERSNRGIFPLYCVNIHGKLKRLEIYVVALNSRVLGAIELNDRA